MTHQLHSRRPRAVHVESVPADMEKTGRNAGESYVPAVESVTPLKLDQRVQRGIGAGHGISEQRTPSLPTWSSHRHGEFTPESP